MHLLVMGTSTPPTQGHASISDGYLGPAHLGVIHLLVMGIWTLPTWGHASISDGPSALSTWGHLLVVGGWALPTQGHGFISGGTLSHSPSDPPSWFLIFLYRFVCGQHGRGLSCPWLWGPHFTEQGNGAGLKVEMEFPGGLGGLGWCWGGTFHDMGLAVSGRIWSAGLLNW